MRLQIIIKKLFSLLPVYYNVKKEEYKRGLDTVAKQYAAKEAEVQTKIDSAREVSKERVETRKKVFALP